MRMLYFAHSGLRYLVLLAALAAIVWFTYALITRRPVDRSLRILGSSFVGLVDLQIVLGLGVLLARPWYPALIGHLVMMVVAAAVIHATLVVNRKKAQPTWSLPLAGVVIGLALILGGIMAIGRGPFTSVPI